MGNGERLNERLTALTEKASSVGQVIEAAQAEDLGAVESFWQILGNENFLRLILASDPLGRSKVKIILSPASLRADKPGMKEAEKIVLAVSDEGDKLRFEVTCHLKINTGNNEFIKTTGLYLYNNVREAEKWASDAYRGEYLLSRVTDSNGKQIGSVGFAIELYRKADVEKLAKSYPGAVGQWLEAIEKFLQV